MTTTTPSPGTDHVPGTVHLTDLDGTSLAKHAGNTDVLLIPAPSKDPEDPLNWSLKRKRLSTFCTLLYTGLVASAFGATPTIIAPLSRDTGLTPNDLSVAFGYAFLSFGWGCLIWQPLAIQYGKRPMYLLSIGGTVAIMVWTAYVKDKSSWTARSVMQGFFGAPVESLAEISLTEIWFQHMRGSFVAYYGLFLFGGIYVMTIISGFIYDGQGWHWVMYWSAIFNAIGLVFLFLFMEETNYSRGRSDEATESTIASSSVSTKDEGAKEAKVTFESLAEIPPAKPCLSRLKLWRPADLRKPNRLMGMMIRPLIFLTYPVVFYSGFSYGAGIIWWNILVNTASAILSPPPYSWSPSIVGLSFVPVLLGTILAFFLCGILGDRFILWMARRNHGISEPEHRLWINVIPIIFVPSSLLLWGVGSSQHVHWFGLMVALFCLGIGIVFLLQINISYCLDSYKDLGAEALVTVILIRNTMNFGFNYGFSPWMTGMGIKNMFITGAFAGVAQMATFLIMIRYGKAPRRRWAGQYQRYAEEMVKAGVAA
ncbi:putative MFS-type transporter, partial [Pseudocercospora fuligena]